ncbi:MAG TPA: DUF3179 domain-containing (seleno)protein [Aggregatilineales bacterium]|nr:DUF3179 domain-containing (seleno)protein [Aggregatilineales bacterium]
MNLLDQRAFDLQRAVLQESAFYPPARGAELYSLEKTIEEGKLTPDANLLVMEIEQRALAFVTLQLVYHHVAQGVLDDIPWVVSFCSICNGGAAFSPLVNDQILQFSVRGVYDAMILMGDDETGSYWDHLTGLCVHGSLTGQRLNRHSNLLHMTARKALTAYPGIQVAFYPLNAEQQTEAEEDEVWRKEAEPDWSARLQQTLANEDTRLPRLDMGLGVWTDHQSRYYPMTRLNLIDNALIEELDGRQLLVYIDPVSQVPDAFYTDATEAITRRDTIQLNNGDTLRDGGVFNKEGQLRHVERPLQLFSRWYAFAVRFPGCGIYAGA